MVFGRAIGIDLGTANVLVYMKGKGIVLNEPSVVAYSASDSKVLAVGTEARQMLGRTPGRVIVTRPMRDGVIADFMITQAMLRYFIRKVSGRYNLFIGERTAEEIKIQIGSALPLERELEMDVRGRDQVEGLPKTIRLTSTEITEALSETLTLIVGNAKTVLEQTPPELAADVSDRGMILTGGGALVRNLDTLFARETGVAAYVAEDPLSCVAIGAGRALENYAIFKDCLTSA